MFQLHIVEFYIILFIKNGKGKHRIDFTDYDCERGTIITVRKDQLHRFAKNKHLTGYLLFFTHDFLASYLEKLETQKTIQLFNELLGSPKIQVSDAITGEISQLIDRIDTEYSVMNDNYSWGIIRSELHILIEKLHRIKAQKEHLINNRKYLSEFIHFQEIVEEHVKVTTKVKDYSSMMGLSTKTLNTIARSIVNKSAKEFIDDICTANIKRLLINTELSIKEIAFASGFEETTNFYKYFKRKTSLTPEKFRDTF